MMEIICKHCRKKLLVKTVVQKMHPECVYQRKRLRQKELRMEMRVNA